MKRFLLSLLAIGFCGITSSFADDHIRAVQSRLKDDGFYFGEVNGVYGSETAAAVSRYQIRHGLPITGQIDAETSKALGVATSSNNVPAPPSEAETWRRLRKTDEQFLTKLNAGKIPSPAPPQSAARQEPAQPSRAATALSVDSASRTLVLSRERLRDYVAAFVLAGLDPQVGAELEFFGERVKYFNEGIVDREKIRRDLQAYNNRWPARRFWLAGEVSVEPQSDSRLRVTFPLRFELRNGSKRSSGRVLKTLVVEVTGEDLQIVGVNEKKSS